MFRIYSPAGYSPSPQPAQYAWPSFRPAMPLEPSSPGLRLRSELNRLFLATISANEPESNRPYSVLRGPGLPALAGFVLSACPAEHQGFSPLILRFPSTPPRKISLGVGPFARPLDQPSGAFADQTPLPNSAVHADEQPLRFLVWDSRQLAPRLERRDLFRWHIKRRDLREITVSNTSLGSTHAKNEHRIIV